MASADDEMFAAMIGKAMVPTNKGLCPCGSEQHGYNLFDHTGRLLMYCCGACEKQRRANTDNNT